MQNHYRKLPLIGLHNARELGGWHTPDGVTQYGVFLRTDMHEEVTPEDIAFLKDYGVTMDVDLRGASELRHHPDPLREEPWCEYVHLPTVEETEEKNVDPSKFRPDPNFSMSAVYVRMAEDRKDWVRKVFEAFGRCEGVAMYHCTLGKDRTGIVTALLLGNCGVSDEDIIADYSVTQVYLSRIIEIYRAKWPPEDKDRVKPMFGTPPETMETLLGHLNEKYGGIPEYLRACGVPDELAARLKARLLGK
ncbi:MAG: tyrosine-protein phosphatase [Oscillospiraceae bacterium]|nr:tyrosine-protein phosphatase [Oscillospiraceae bacterium]